MSGTPTRCAWYLAQLALVSFYESMLETYADGYGALPVITGLAGEWIEEENIFVHFVTETADLGNSIIILNLGVQTHLSTSLERHAKMQACLDDLLYSGTEAEPHVDFITSVNTIPDVGISIQAVNLNESTITAGTSGMFRHTFRNIDLYVRLL